MGIRTAGVVAPRDVPEAQAEVPDDQQLPIIQRGMGVFDADGHKVGNIADFAIDTESEQLTHLRVHRGLLFGRDTDIPVEWIKAIDVKGILLSVTKPDLAGLSQRAA